MYTSSNQWVLVGLTSFGQGCAEAAHSGVYTRVAAFQSWIKSNTNGSYSSVSFSHSNAMKTSMYYVLFFVILPFLVKFHSYEKI
jgi:secreted trypsin-like serine protease